MSEFTFDVKAFVTVHVTAEDEARARQLVEDYVPGLMEGLEITQGAPTDPLLVERVFINSASLDGEHDLVEVDGEDPEALERDADVEMGDERQ